MILKNLTICFFYFSYVTIPLKKYMLFTRQEVHIRKNCAQGLGYRKTEGTVFPNMD